MPRNMQGIDPNLGQRLAAWLREFAGIDSPRRAVRASADTILVSKFDVGFAARLHVALARLPELFDLKVVSRKYQRVALQDPAARRVDVWQRAIAELLARLATERSIAANQQAEILAGIDSVAGLLDSVLWSGPTISDCRGASPVESQALADVLSRMDADAGIFTRFYGAFEGRSVVNHCPGAPFARVLLDQAWTLCAAPSPAG